ncbi:hypothetical protein Dshi_3093 [Dinoroseobacter shibae DFL 12 = DSM 16493]|jgi:hypothetical protein|uniref:Uncharacterized protein n=1 Tax=Dinoroseobacter shibae (strain DSM 16493 / NCIMB 14021 / DFL 12) TaxID=398580 RepID=A8LL77_DINSH|nr:hypothetical protein [Dinoroseobacter shibae]ABV94826.1 hypothetical protein Dshi_3093 [Dinoroseobacter shibae DFL 12 = DSM 16493]URF46246.1 hypothetical protein M8008_15920 [Dinoroseobacter shibae]URF50553.1 hypothetical protein M8007_15920 [Dinoroseobacter shibae]
MIEVPAHETGIVRVFAVNGDSRGSGTAQSFLTRLEQDPEDIAAEAVRLREMLGADQIDPTYTETFAVKDVADLGLSRYIATAMDVPMETLAPDRARLDALEGEVLIVLSRALGDTAQTLTPGADLTFIGAYKMAEVPLTGPVKAPPPDPMPAPTPVDEIDAPEEISTGRRTLIVGAALLIAALLVMIVGASN